MGRIFESVCLSVCLYGLRSSNLVHRQSTKTRTSDKRHDLQGQRWRSQGHVTRLIGVGWCRERNVLETPKLVGRLPTPRATMPTSFKVKGQRSRLQWSITLHNNTSFRTTIAFYSNSLGGDTSTITLLPALHCHSLLARWRYWQQQYGVGSHSMSSF